MHRRPLSALALGASALLVVLALPVPEASACGGLFCANSGPTQVPAPVDQNAERILFAVHDDGTITAHVQIQYRGDPESFAWVVPVPGVPAVEDSSMEVFEALDAQTAQQVLYPANEQCPVPSSSDTGCGCASRSLSTSGAGGGIAADGVGGGQGSVTVFAHDFTENYEFHVIGGQDTAELVTWLQDEDYNVSDNMTPTMDAYNSEDMRFLALKLQSDKDARDIVPVAMTYEATAPMIPLQLTAVAAQPYMGILVWVLAEQAMKPAGGDWSVVDLDEDQLLFDGTRTTNYFAWVARQSAEAEGRLFVWESAGPNPVQGQTVAGFALDQPWLGRFYTRMSPEHMTADPQFAHTQDDTSRSNFVDLSARQTLWECGGTIIASREPERCAFHYCGPGAECAVIDDRVACHCAEGDVAINFMDPAGNDTVTCVPADNPFAVTQEAGGAGTDFDPCASVDCGAGTCWLKGGFPTCDCDPGAFACLEADGSILCQAPPATSTTFGPGGGMESASADTPAVRARREQTKTRYAIPAWIPLGFLWLLGIRRRLRAA